MSFEVELTDHFKKEARKLIKKYPSLKNELEDLAKNLPKTLQLVCH
jgi:hypothetical protein